VSIYADLYRYRELFGNLIRRDLQTRYKGSALGVLWSLINPLVLMGIYVLVFSLLWKVAQVPHYALYLLVGLTVWLWTSLSGFALVVGLCWLAAGFLWLLWVTRGFQRPTPVLHVEE